VDSKRTAAEPPSIAEVVKGIDEVSTLPRVMQRILDIVSDPNSGAGDLQDILQTDPALTAKLLRVVNSTYYGLREKVGNVKRAVVFLGFKTVKNIAVAASVCDLFQSDESIKSYSRNQLWRHCVAVAVCSRSIALRAGLNITEEVFTMGIMHDIGIIIEDQYVHDAFVQCVESPAFDESGLVEAEQRHLGFHHGRLGSQVALSWGIAPDIAKPMAYHHDPSASPEQHSLGAAILYLADVLCAAKKIGFAPCPHIEKSQMNYALDILGFNRDDVSLILKDMTAEVEKAHELFVL
jgi:HD-like signal output (HDOD) protein